jgi:hypothetical protein
VQNPAESRKFLKLYLDAKGEGSAPADWVAVGGVGGELVSGVRSLLSRENTGNFSDFGLL